MTYNSTCEIKKDFQIDSDDLEIIREGVNAIRIDTHPDKTNGEFPSEIIKEQYYKANNAIEYLDSIKNNQSLVIVEKMTDLMKVITDLIPINKQNSLEQNLDSKISFAISTFQSKMFLPKISLTVITAIVTFLFLFPAQIKDNPTLSHFINPTSLYFVSVWFCLLFYSGIFWMMAFNNEEKSKKKLMLLKVDSVQNQVFENFIARHLTDNKFIKDELTHFIYESSIENRLGELDSSEGLSSITTRFFGSEMITMEIAQNIAELIISRGEKNKVIEKLAINALSDIYEIKNYR
ncbi:hypothetical protein [Flavobacterium sp. ABG]|uniref:hypothetical protein n=1 Tax=Flavobacterium sp. ABG TaxID=1423322 RepID=UPI0006499FED|nr:hypothetical protein [Flavobacterium sp. ABG]KLT70220.1 hypothetical protein AB674_08385 [Flavobacterium sp. ABG]